MEPKSFTFVAAFMAECCIYPHLYCVTVTADTRAKAKAKALREIRRTGDPNEIMEIPRPNTTPIEEVRTQTFHGRSLRRS